MKASCKTKAAPVIVERIDLEGVRVSTGSGAHDEEAGAALNRILTTSNAGSEIA